MIPDIYKVYLLGLMTLPAIALTLMVIGKLKIKKHVINHDSPRDLLHEVLGFMVDITRGSAGKCAALSAASYLFFIKEMEDKRAAHFIHSNTMDRMREHEAEEAKTEAKPSGQSAA